ncbi:MAG: DUF3987 domain-containing protein [Actinomycetes bacterium]
MTLCLMIQPAVLTTIAKHESFRGRGLLARILYVVPPTMVGRRKASAAFSGDVAHGYAAPANATTPARFALTGFEPVPSTRRRGLVCWSSGGDHVEDAALR